MRKARRKLGKRQRDIAAEVGCTQPAVHAWEADLAAPRTTQVRSVARAYGLVPERILPDELPASAGSVL
jgi:transcriptional regulator with XRE-family HTH domain